MRACAPRAATCLPVLALLLIPVILSGTLACRPDPCDNATDPLRGLLCETSSPVFDEAYWRAEARADSPIWQEALAFCRERAFPRATRCSLLARLDQELTARREAEAARQSLEDSLRRLGSPDGFTGLPPGREPRPEAPTTPAVEPPTPDADPS